MIFLQNKKTRKREIIKKVLFDYIRLKVVGDMNSRSFNGAEVAEMI